MQANYDHCEALVRERDRERFLATLFAPAEKRPHLFALYAFDLELAHVPDAVREPMAGEIRLQWWREALAGERTEEARSNPVAAALLETIEANALPGAPLIEAIDARQFDLLGQPMNTRDQLLRYLDATSSGVVRLAANMLGGSAPSGEPMREAGRTLGIVRRLRNFARDVSKGRLFVPLELLATHEVHTASVLGGENSAGLRAALAEMRGWAHEEYAALRAAKVGEEALPALLPAALTPLYLSRMEKRASDPFYPDGGVSELRSQLTLWWTARRGRL